MERKTLNLLIKQIENAPVELWEEISFFNDWSRSFLTIQGLSEIDLISYRYSPKKACCEWRHLSPRILNKLNNLGPRDKLTVPTKTAKEGNELIKGAANRIYATSSYLLKFGFNHFSDDAYSIFLKETSRIKNYSLVESACLSAKNTTRKYKGVGTLLRFVYTLIGLFFYND